MSRTDRDTRMWGIKHKNKNAPYQMYAVQNTLTMVVPVSKYATYLGLVGRVKNTPDTMVEVTTLPAGTVLYTPSRRTPGHQSVHSTLQQVCATGQVPRQPEYTQYKDLYRYGTVCVNGVIFPVDNTRNRTITQGAYGAFTVTTEPLKLIQVTGKMLVKRYESFNEWVENTPWDEKRVVLVDPWETDSKPQRGRFTGSQRKNLTQEANTGDVEDVNY